jgi:hypothetical protein
VTLYAVFDVESIGLHGEGFAFGAVVIDENGRELDHQYAASPVDAASGPAESRNWVKENIPPLRVTVSWPHSVRDVFWGFWTRWQAQGAKLAADVPWPVETNFLSRCVADARGEQRDWQGPYPLIDVASVRRAAGLDPLAEEQRLEAELPKHDPLADARQSARLLIEALTATGEALSSLEAMHG